MKKKKITVEVPDLLEYGRIILFHPTVRGIISNIEILDRNVRERWKNLESEKKRYEQECDLLKDAQDSLDEEINRIIKMEGQDATTKQ